MLRWIAWAVLILLGGTFLVMPFSVFVTAAVDGLEPRKLPVLLAIVLFAVIFTWFKCGFNSIRRRPDQMNRWRERFPTQSEEEIQRFLQVVGESLDLQIMHSGKLSPDDRGADLDPLFGGMELVQILMAVEEAYGVDLPDDFLKTCESLGQMFAYVTQHRRVRPVSCCHQTSQPTRPMPQGAAPR